MAAPANRNGTMSPKSQPRLIAALIVAASLAGCLPTATLEHTPDMARLCKTTEPRGWDARGGSWTLPLRDGGLALFGWTDAGSTRTIPGPLKDVYWVEFTAFTVGHTREAPRPPMVFDPTTVVLHLNGREVRALPRLWLAEQVAGYHEPTTELPVPGRLTAAALLEHDFFLAFPVPPPPAHDSWRLTGGAIEIEGHVVPLPDAESCFTPARTWWAPIY